MDASRVANEIEARLRSLGTRKRAEHEQQYLKSELEHLGATVGRSGARSRRSPRTAKT